jgi:transcription antitermination factor NusG
MSRIETPRSWHVAYTFPKAERKAFYSLAKMGITSYFPVHFVFRQWSDRVKRLEMPLFPNYIFIHISPQERHEALEAKELVRYVCFDGKPATVPNSLIDSLKSVSEGEVEVSNETFDQIGMPVCISEGPFTGVKGILIRRNGKSKLVVRIESLKSAVLVEIPANCATPLDKMELDICMDDEIAVR